MSDRGVGFKNMPHLEIPGIFKISGIWALKQQKSYQVDAPDSPFKLIN